MRRLRHTIVFLLAFTAVCQGRGKVTEETVAATPDACIRTERAHLRFPGSADSYGLFIAKLDSLLRGEKDEVRIWHIGASHVQGGTFSNTVRENFASMAAGMRGNRGFLFPMRLAGTNQEKGYFISTEGKWKSELMTKSSDRSGTRYGVTGFAATTSDPGAKVFLDLGINGKGLWSFNKLRILGYSSGEGTAAPSVRCGQTSVEFVREEETASFLFSLPEDTDTLSIGFDIPENQSFTLTGIQPLSSRPGVSYYSSGVNGSTSAQWAARAVDLERDLALIRPDLCIIGLGINDSAGSSGRFNAEAFKGNIRSLIAKVRHSSPGCAFVFITTNDCYYFVSRRRMAYNSNAPLERKAIYELAQEYDGAVWDLYDLMGGAKSVNGWKAAGLMSRDRLHFSPEGYRLLGNALFNALIEGTDDLD
ncbi:MAG: GDSL-type esterase/lipase family protein [Bacteroidales bacterium]|nr:GDSL-type esterase/lipase family protein [Bacteroidales bacterium]